MKPGLHGTGRYLAGAAIGPARWPHYDLIVVMEGSLTLVSGSKTAELFTHDAVLIPPGVSFQGTTGKEGSGIWVQHFSASRKELPRAFPPGRKPVLLGLAASSEVAGALLRRLHQLHSSGRRGNRLLRAALLAALLRELYHAARHSRLRSGETSRLRIVTEWVERHLEQVKTLRAVARQADLSESHFRNVFRKWRTQSAGAWLRDLRMTEARRLLLSTNMPTKAISARIGFGDPVAFSRCFRRVHGIPPGQFRHSHPLPV